jgi:hypothetical protein
MHPLCAHAPRPSSFHAQSRRLATAGHAVKGTANVSPLSVSVDTKKAQIVYAAPVRLDGQVMA